MAEYWQGGGGVDGAIHQAAGHIFFCCVPAQDLEVHDLVAADIFGS